MTTLPQRLAEARAALITARPGAGPEAGLGFTAWYASATQRLLGAATDEDPALIRVHSAEAKVAALLAAQAATNSRQIMAAEKLVEAIELMPTIADTIAVPPVVTHEI